jgi:hypothetical protein
MSLINLSPAQLRHAADLKEKIEALQHELSHLHGGSEAAPAAPAGRAKRKISAAGIARIRAAQKLRWSKAKGTKAAKPGKRGPRKMSASARAKIAAAQKARWAKFHAAKGGK